jgi:putative endonuclease
MERQPCVYILTNHCNGTLYIGVTSDLPKRIWQHKKKSLMVLQNNINWIN